jgi:hypothetical protein
MRKIILLAFAFLLLTSPAFAATYYVKQSSAGNDSGDSCVNAKSISWYNSNAAAGDTGILCDGTFTTGIAPANSGTSGNAITYQAATQYAAIITSSTGAALSSRNYITIDGVYIKNNSTRWVTASGSSNLTIQNSKFYDARSYNGMLFENTTQIKILNNIFEDAPILPGWTGDRWGSDCQSAYEARTALPSYCDWLTAPSDAIRFNYGGKLAVVEGNTFGDADHSAVAVLNGDDVVIRNNTVRTTLHTGIGINSQYAQDIKARILAENNTMVDSGINYKSNPVSKSRWYAWKQPAFQLAGLSIIRNNTVLRGGSGIWLAGYTPSSDRSGRNSRVYHNSVHGTRRNQNLYGDDVNVSGIKIVNNIFSGAIEREVDNQTDYGSTTNYWINNAWTPNANNFYFKKTNTVNRCLETGGSGDCSNGYLEVLYPTEWHVSNFYANPFWADVDEGDFNLTQFSTAMIDAAAFLTTITSSNGSGTSFVVADPLFFYDGWGITGETGDTIYTSAGQSATITAINYTTGQITVGSSITWTQGDGVTTINYTGSAPDMGAIQYGEGEPPPVIPDPPSRASTGKIIYAASARSIGYHKGGGGISYLRAPEIVEGNIFSGNANVEAVYRFENNLQDSQGTNHLTGVNSPGYEADNPLEGFYSLSLASASQQYAYINHVNLDYTFPSTFTILLRFMYKTSSVLQYFFTKYDVGENQRTIGIGLGYFTGDRRVAVYHGYNSGVSYENISHDSVLTVGVNYAVAYSYDNSTKAYRIRVWNMDTGAVVGTDKTGNHTNTISLTESPVRIGARDGASYFNGDIDEVVIAAEVWSTGDMDAYFNSTYGH